MKKLIYLIPLFAIFFFSCKKEEVKFNIVGTTWKGSFYNWPTTLIFGADGIVNFEINSNGTIFQEVGNYTMSYIEDSYYPHVTFNTTTSSCGFDDQDNKVESFVIRGDMQVIQNKNGYFLDGTYSISAKYKGYIEEFHNVGYYTTYYSDFKLVK